MKETRGLYRRRVVVVKTDLAALEASVCTGSEWRLANASHFEQQKSHQCGGDGGETTKLAKPVLLCTVTVCGKISNNDK
jgi:hypothetical protein